MLQDLINPESCRSCAGDDDSGVLLQEIIRSHAGEEKSGVLQEVLQEMTSPDAGGARNSAEVKELVPGIHRMSRTRYRQDSASTCKELCPSLHQVS